MACEAKPIVVGHGWRTDEACASKSADVEIHYGGVEHYVCKIHAAAWWRALAQENEDAVAARWGWARA